MFLDDMYPCLVRLVAPGQSQTEKPPPPLHLLSLPRPASEDTIVLTVLVTTVTHALNALLFLLSRSPSPFSASAFISALQHSDSLLAWAPNMKCDGISDNTRDTLLTRAYTAITTKCTALASDSGVIVDPKSMFCLRIYALSCLLYTSPGTIKPATFWDQLQRACLSYARAYSSSPASTDEVKESAVAACISSHLSELVRVVQGSQIRAFAEGRSFVQMCEMWMSFAKKVSLTLFSQYCLFRSLSFGQRGDFVRRKYSHLCLRREVIWSSWITYPSLWVYLPLHLLVRLHPLRWPIMPDQLPRTLFLHHPLRL
jgi:separase